MNFAVAAIVLFCLAVPLGLWLALRWYRVGRGTPLSYLHGLAGAAGVALLFVRIATGPRNFGYNSGALLFCLALTGGLMLLAFSARREAPPFPLIIIHGGAAFSAFLVVLLSYLHH